MPSLGPYLWAAPAAAGDPPGPLALPPGVPVARMDAAALARSPERWVVRHLFLPSTRLELTGPELAGLRETPPRLPAGVAGLAHGIVVDDDPGAAWTARRQAGIRRLEWITWGGIGDVILGTPLLRRVRRRAPWLRISVRAVRPEHLHVLAGSPHVDDAAPFRAGAPPPGPETLRFHPCYGVLNPSGREARGAAHVVAGCLGETLDDARPALFLLPDELRAAAARVPPGEPYVVAHTTGSRPQKGWDPAGWAELARTAGVRMVQLGGPGDEPLPGAADLRGLPLRVAFAVLAGAAAFVGVDSSLQHAAAALGVPAVVLFGPTPAAVFGHPGAVNLSVPECGCHRDVARWPACARRCLDALPAGAVAAALRTVLAASPSSPSPAAVA